MSLTNFFLSRNMEQTSGTYDTPWGRDRARNGPEGGERAILSVQSKPSGQSGQGRTNRAVVHTSAFQAHSNAHFRGLSGKTGRGLTTNDSCIDANLQDELLC